MVNRIISAAQKMQSFGCNLYEFDPGGNVWEGVSGYRPYDVAIWTLPPNLGTVLSPTPPKDSTNFVLRLTYAALTIVTPLHQLNIPAHGIDFSDTISFIYFYFLDISLLFPTAIASIVCVCVRCVILSLQ